MTIRTRLTLWYAAILCASTLLIAGLSYVEFQREAAIRHGKPASEAEEQDWWEDVVQITLFCGVPAALLGLAGGWWLMQKALSPVAALTDAANRLNEKNLHERLARTGNGDELDRLSEVFNSMTARLQGSFQRIREFTLHASHELKTPLTIMQGEVETALRDENLSVSQRESLLSQLDEIQRLARIVDGLTLLTKADAGQVNLSREPVRLHELVRDSFEDAEILAQPAGVKVQLTSCDEITIDANRHRLRQLLLNLTDNAIKYNHPGGTVEISLVRIGEDAEVKISNTGPGISPEVLPRVFDRFYRGHESHGKAVEGCGLGLSIAQWIVHAHGGRIEISSTAEKTSVVVLFPVIGRKDSCNSNEGTAAFPFGAAA